MEISVQCYSIHPHGQMQLELIPFVTIPTVVCFAVFWSSTQIVVKYVNRKFCNFSFHQMGAELCTLNRTAEDWENRFLSAAIQITLSLEIAAMLRISPNSWVAHHTIHGGKLRRPNQFLVARIILPYLKKKTIFFSNTKCACFFSLIMF